MNGRTQESRDLAGALQRPPEYSPSLDLPPFTCGWLLEQRGTDPPRNSWTILFPVANDMKLEGQVAIVTGGATGMGRGISALFAKEGARVLVNYRASAEAAKEVVEEIRRNGGEAIAHAADVQQDEQVQSMVALVEERWGRLDVLVNNAGWSKVTPHWKLDDLTDEIWDRTLNTNLRGAFYCCRAAVPLMRKNGGGSIVNNASASVYNAAGSSIVYSASKAALVNMTKSLARALAPDIRVNAIAPGLVHTRFAGWPAEAFEQGRETSPLKRIASVDDVASTVLFLATDARAITAETILIDCGSTLLATSRPRRR